MNQYEVISFSTTNTALFDEACTVRHEVFIVEQQIAKDIEFDGLDPVARQYLAQHNHKAVGTARYRTTDKGIKLERFAVLMPYRKLGVGAALLKQMLADTLPVGKKIYLHAQETAVGFYEKYGFCPVGDSFLEADIVHYTMVYAIR